MSVHISSQDEAVDYNICNGDLLALCALAKAYNEDVPEWDGNHDGHAFTSEQLQAMARRLQQLSQLVPMLYRLAKHGGAVIS